LPDTRFDRLNPHNDLLSGGAGPPRWKAIVALAASHFEIGEFDEAVRWISQSLVLAPVEEQENCRDRLAAYNSRRET
jgi:hypothetical protein